MDQTFSKQIELRLFSNSGNIFLAGLCASTEIPEKKHPESQEFWYRETPRNPPPKAFYVFRQQNLLSTPESFGNARLGCTNLQSSYSIESTYGLIEVRKTGHKSNLWGKSMGISDGFSFKCHWWIWGILNACDVEGNMIFFGPVTVIGNTVIDGEEFFFDVFLCVCVVLEGCK